jgi:type I restriction-modification system DNA methylase subunit
MRIMSKDQASGRIRDLVERYDEAVRDGKIPKFTEADVGSKFILPFLEALGWDVKNIDEVREQRRTLTGPADYSLNVNGQPKIVVEIKKFGESLDTVRAIRGKEESYSEQAIRYAWHMKADWVILSNFAETRLYYSHVIKPEDGLIFKFKHNDYLKNLDKIWIFSREGVVSGILDTYEKRRIRKDIDEEVLGDLFECRKLLVDSIRKNNQKLSKEEIKESVQKILDRILVIRVAEDRGVIGSDSLWKELDSWKNRGLPTPFMRSLKSLFRDFDDVYNSKLFAKHPCEDLTLDNDMLEKVITLLYKYNFDLISADVLGAIYEDYIGHVLQEAEKNVGIVKDYGTRKEAGIYYTPTHVVEYIVKNALGRIDNKSPEQISKIKILDPSCGSGSFLIKAFDFLKEYYEKYNKNQRTNSKVSDLTVYAKMIHDLEKRIITENIFGVDLDPQAAEIAAVNLMLKALRKGERLPLILDDNIKSGNSLISGTEDELKKYFGSDWIQEKPFNWEDEFPDIFKLGGFDIVIGNPPHGAKLSEKERTFFSKKYQVAEGYKNTASLFIERSFQLMKPSGVMGLVIPKSLTFSERWNVVRNFILKNFEIIEIADISKAFPGVLLEQIILLCRRGPQTTESYKGTRLYWNEAPQTHDMPIALCNELDSFPIHIDPQSLTIYKKVRPKSKFFSEISHTFRGLPIQSMTTAQRSAKSEPLLRGDDIKPYYHGVPQTFVNEGVLEEENKKIVAMRKPKIVSQRIVAHVLRPTDHIIIMSTLDEDGLLNVDTVENILAMDPDYDLRYLLAFLNSKLLSWYAYTFIFNKAVRTMDFDNYYVGKLPIYPAKPKEQKSLINEVGRMLELTKSLTEMHSSFKDYINKYPRLEDTTLETYYRRISPEEKQVKISSNLKGSIKHAYAKEEDEWLVFSIDGVLEVGNLEEEANELEVLRLKIKDEDLRQFILYCVQSGEISQSKSNVLKRILQVKLPHFSKDDKTDLKTIREIMKTFTPFTERRNHIKEEILTLENEINKKIYALYGLTEHEIAFIESTLSPGSVVIDMLE